MKIAASRYTSEAWKEQEQEQIWSKHWLLVAHKTQFQYSGDMEVVSVADREVVIVLSPVGFKAFLNSCPHRGTLLIPESCKGKKSIQCPLHKWKFSLTGEALDIPEPKPEQAVGLHQVHCEEAFGFVWLNFSL